ncbi:hypothetical protein DL768_011407 [Monosporascus sp. mg162]|nr:hypothetical protein DL768_011407 [Monosporascus sp. mg162]
MKVAHLSVAIAPDLKVCTFHMLDEPAQPSASPELTIGLLTKGANLPQPHFRTSPASVPAGKWSKSRARHSALSNMSHIIFFNRRVHCSRDSVESPVEDSVGPKLPQKEEAAPDVALVESENQCPRYRPVLFTSVGSEVVAGAKLSGNVQKQDT